MLTSFYTQIGRGREKEGKRKHVSMEERKGKKKGKALAAFKKPFSRAHMCPFGFLSLPNIRIGITTLINQWHEIK